MVNGTALDEANAAMALANTDPAKAVPVAARALRRAEREQHAEAAAVAERACGVAALYCGDMAQAGRHLRRAVDRGLRAGSAEIAAQARLTLAFVINQEGKPAAALREIGIAIRDLTGVTRAKATAQRGAILYQVGQLDDAMNDYQAALPIMRRAGDKLGVQRTLVNRALVHGQRHAFAAAHADLTEAERLATELGRDLALGIIHENLGFVEILRGDVPAALGYLAAAERRIEANGGLVGPTLQDHSELLLSAGLVREAREASERAIAAYQRERRQLRLPEARLQLAQAAHLGHDWETARRHARKAAAEFRRQDRPEWAALARLAIVRAYLAGGDGARIKTAQADELVAALAETRWPAAALEARLVASTVAGRRGNAVTAKDHLRHASLARRRGPATLRARGWYAEARLRLESGDRRGSATAARAGLRILDDHSAVLGATDLRVHAAGHRTDLAELGLGIALADGRPERVFEWAERGRASQLLRRPARPPDDQVLAQLLSEVRATVRDIDTLRGTGTSTARLVQQQVTLERRIRDHVRLHRDDSAQRLPPPVSRAALARALGDSALVEFVQRDGHLYALTSVAGRLRLHRLGDAAAASRLIERLPFALHRMARREADPATIRAARTLLGQAAEKLDGLLLGPLAELGERPLVVVPTGALHSLPWSLLPSCVGRPLTVAPSATLWQLSSTRPAGGQEAVGVAAGPRLRSARGEAKAVAEIHGTTPLVDEDATVDAVLAMLGETRIAHLAAHGRLSADNPLFSDLLLADGPLVVYDIERLARVPETVVLAACDSGRSMVYAGDELLGLSATFISRGAVQLIASVLPVPDAETVPLMVGFHRRLAAGEAPAVALAAAQLELSSDLPAAIAAAAGFVCIGAGFAGRDHGDWAP